MKVLHVAIYGDRTGFYLNSLGFFEAKNCSTLVQARDAFIKKFRAEYKRDFWIPGSESPASVIYKFPFRDLVGYYHFEDGLSFVFPEGHPVYKLVQSKNYKDNDLAEKLCELYCQYDELRQAA